MRRGLSPAELIVILLVIAALIAILFPVFAVPMHRHSAARERCQDNVREIASALRMYGADHDERLPPATQARDRRTITLPSLLHPYSKHHYLWQCPTLARQGDHVFTYDGSANDTTVSYGFNRSALNVNGRGIRTAQARDPAFTVAFVDSLFYLAAPTAIASELGSAAPSAQHDAFVTVAWLDGHVSSQRLGKLETLIGVEGGRLTGKGIDRYRYWNLR